MTKQFDGLTEAELCELDASLTTQASQRWDAFHQDRAKPCVFFGTAPDESLAAWVQSGVLRPGRAIDLGCGNGRNAVFLARQGFAVQAVDYSRTAIEWARDRIAEAGVEVALTQQSVFDLQIEAGTFDLVYHSGCFHHMPPHRRKTYVDLVANALKPGGYFGLTCFRPEGGSGYTDSEVYERRSLGGGLGYTEQSLREVWSSALQVRILRQMHKPSADSGLFGEEFLWAMLAHRG